MAFWYEPDAFAILDHAQQILWLAASEIGDIDQLETRLSRKDRDDSSNYSTSAPEFLTSQPDYETAVNRAKKYIQAGEIFQANLSLKNIFRLEKYFRRIFL